MSSPATMVRIRGGVVEYLERGNTYDAVESVIEGPDAVRDYLDGRGNWARRNAIRSRTSINSAEDEGCLLSDYDNRVIIFFGGDIECSYWQQQEVMEEIASASRWDGWDVRWAYKGLLDAARYLGQVPELLDGPFFGRVDTRGCLLIEDTVTDDVNRASSVIAVKANGRLDVYPLDTMFPEDLLHYGEPELVSMLNNQGCFSQLRLEDYDFVRGFLFDEDAMQVTYWGLCCELVPEYLEEAWQGWKAIDLEGNRKEFDRIIGSHFR